MRRSLILCFSILILCCEIVVADGCCGWTDEGAQCATVSQDKCSEDFSEGVECRYSSFCEEGCCYDEELGVFDSRVLKTACGKEWVKNPTCDLPGAQRGCCILGEETVYETEGQCRVDTIDRMLGPNEDVDWRSIDKAACFVVAEYQARGACVMGDRKCRIKTEAECWEMGGEFSEDYLCTSPDLNTSCEMTEETSCEEGKDGVYFLDSCGNAMNIYDSSKVGDVDYWSTIVSLEDSCGFGSNNGNSNSSSCGNCDRFDGGRCSSAIEDNFDVDSGGFYCEDLSCDYEGVNYNNGESWCDHDGVIGNGLDSVGSRYWKYSCNYGEIQVDACDDYRNDVCVQNFLKKEAGGDSVEAKCIKNDWRECIDYNDLERTEWPEQCNENPFCEIKNVSIDKFFFGVCAPKYPGGFDLLDARNKEENEDVCDRGTETCTSYYVKVFRGHKFKWKCEANCDCEKRDFVEKMNDVCISLGDCGGYVNYDGDYSDRGYTSNRGEIGEEKMSDYLNNTFPVLGLYIKTSDYINETMDGTIEGGGEGYSASGLSQFFDKYFSIFNIFGWGDIKKKRSTFTCMPWQPPVGSDKCNTCNDDPLKPCSEYRCESLGAGCEIVNKGTRDEFCDSAIDDGIPPKLSANRDILFGEVDYGSVNDDGFELTNSVGGCINAYTPLTFGITTNELSQCMFDIEAIDYENMSYNLDGNAYSYIHTTTFTLPDPSHGQSQGLNWTGELSFYIKCRDRLGHESPGFHKVDMCVKEGDDIGAPLIRGFDPVDNTVFKYGATSVNVSIATNELSTCRWDLTDTDYSLMGNYMVCEDFLGLPSSSQGYVCTDSFDLINGTNDYYVRCMDQPWLNESGEKNANTESTAYRLRKVEKKISIEKIKPDTDFEISGGSEAIELKVQTAGGGDVHVCSFSFSGYESMLEMYETKDDIHIQAMTLGNGEQKLYVECEDETGDFDRSVTEFNIIRDSSTPAIARAWQKSGELFIITTEAAECRYSTRTCKFNWDDGILMGMDKEHMIDAMRGDNYFIKCEDEFGNAPVGCSITLRAL